MKWIKIMDYATDIPIYAQSAVFDPNLNCIYISLTLTKDQQRQILKFDLDKLEISTLTNCNSNGDFCSLLFVNNELHQIGGGYDKVIHSVWSMVSDNLQTTKIEYPLPDCVKDSKSWHKVGLIYLK